MEYCSIVDVLGWKMGRDRSFHSNKIASDLVVAKLVLLYGGVIRQWQGCRHLRVARSNMA